jgi:RNA polymerase sigma-70 factor, ECF subfamily
VLPRPAPLTRLAQNSDKCPARRPTGPEKGLSSPLCQCCQFTPLSLHAEILVNVLSERVMQFATQSRTWGANAQAESGAFRSAANAGYLQPGFSRKQAVTRVTLQGTNLMWPKAVVEMDLVVEKAKNGDRSAFEKLYTFYKTPVYALCLRLTRDALDAEDLTQEVFMQVYRKVNTFRGEAAFGSWLYRVATNVTMMHLRKRHFHVPLDVLEPESRPLSSTSSTGSYNPCDPVERISLLRAVCGLSKSGRTQVLLHDLKGLSHQEISQRLGVNVNTSKAQLHRAHRDLRDILNGSQMRAHRPITHHGARQMRLPGAARTGVPRRDADGNLANLISL